MDISTEALINKAIETNSEIQADNLTMLNMCNVLCSEARLIDALESIDKVVMSEDFDELTFKALDIAIKFSDTLNLDKDACLKMTKDDRRATLHAAIENFVVTCKSHISSTLIDMLDVSMKDMFEYTEFDKAKKLPKDKVFIYSKEAIDTITDSLHNIIQNVGFLNDNSESFSTVLNQFASELEEPMSLVHTKIGYEGFVSIDVPQPKIQTVTQASIMTVKDIDDISDSLNNVTYKEMRDRVTQIKTNVTNRIATCDNVEDAIKSIHFMAQMIMSVKNSVTLMKNYHKATLNEINL